MTYLQWSESTFLEYGDIWSAKTNIRQLLNEFLRKERITSSLELRISALLRLDRGCKVPFGNHLKAEIDDLKSKHIDKPEQEKEYQRIIENWKRTDEQVESKMLQYLKQSTLERSFELSKETVKEVLADKYFVETEQFHAAKEKLLRNKVIVLNGAPGEGKTTIAKKLLLGVANNQRYIQLHSYAEWETVNIDGVNAILIDDMFGAGSFSKEEYRKWQKHIPAIAIAVKNKRLYLIITSRKYILSEALEKMFVQSIFSEENIFTLSSKELKGPEKQGILEKHFCKASEENFVIREACLKKEHSETISQIVKLELCGPELGGLTIGFPECTRLFSSSVSLYEKGIEFYKDPMACVKTYMSELLADDEILIAFFVLWAQESKFLISLELERPIDDTAGNIIAPIRQLQFQPDKHIRKIRHVLRQHRGGFINFDGKNESFTFSHRVVQDAVGLVTYEINPTAVIEHSDSSFIDNFIRAGKESYDSVSSCNIGQLIIHVSHARYSQVSCRLGSFIMSPDSETLKDPSLLRLCVFEDKDFCLEFLNALNRQGCLKTFLKAKTRSLRSEFAEFKFLNDVSTDMGVLAYLVWMKEDTCPLLEVCIYTMLSLELETEKELCTSLLIAVKLGSCKLVNFLIAQGAKVNLNHTLLSVQRGNKDVLERLLKDTDISSRSDILYKACKAGYVNVVSTILDDECDLIKLDDVDSKRMIENAITGGHAGLLKYFLQKNTLETDLTFDVRGNELPFYHFVILKQKTDLLDVLTEAGYRPKNVDSKGRTPFLYAIYSGKSSILLKLLKLSVKENVHCLPDNAKNTALYMAIRKVITSSGPERNVFHDIALRLCSFYDNIHLKNDNGKQTALELACKGQLDEIANAIIQHGDPFVKKGTTLFHHFVTTGSSQMLSTLLKCNIDPNQHDNNHRTPFMLANALGKVSILEMLQEDQRIKKYNKELGIELNTRNISGTFSI
ncbi:uncharacterized protein LOC132718829 [Ruditapes philippinarum]|uniref:uncharacterized protein LOC132718829 n=1 Tax=Ruditapes philippinarum TaxID=129788 RepID=UPI00295BD7EF|nr:uncharacterized protein LOC132718829 [Ruditapes philippinarum]